MAIGALAARRRGWQQEAALSGLILMGSCAVALLLPRLVEGQTSLALALVVVLVAIGVAAISPITVVVVAVPGIVLAGARLGGTGGGGLALGDVLLIAGFALAVPALLGQAPTVAKPVLLSFGLYLALLVPSVVVNHDRVALVEVIHRVAVIVGGLSVGLVLQRTGKLTLALRLLMAVAAVIALAAVAEAPLHGFHAVYPLGLHKNFAGPIMGRSAAVLLIAPQAVGLAKRHSGWLIALLIFGVAATQSRNAVIALTVAAVIWVVRSGGLRKRGGAAALGLVVALAGFAAYTLVHEFESSQSADVHNSYTERTRVEQETRDLWRTSPVYGVGLRFFNTPAYSTYEAPNNVFDEILAEAGDLGAVGMAIFIVGSIGALARGRGNLATAGLTLVTTAFLSGQFDIFWVNGQALPWMIAGAGAAADTRNREPARPVTVGL